MAEPRTKVAPNWTYEGRITRVNDGDTVDITLDLGFNVFHRGTFRLYGINTPELYKGKERAAGMRAAEGVLHWLHLNPPERGRGALGHGDRVLWYQDLPDYSRRTKKGFHILRNHPKVVVRSHDGKRVAGGKYGRWLVEIYQNNDVSLNDWLVTAGFAERKEY